MWFEWQPYVPVAQRRLNTQRELEKLDRKGTPRSPVVIEGRTIARTFWGRSWCENLERYSDFANRLPRGRTYVRAGSVVDLQVTAGQVAATVAGSQLYRVSVKVSPVPRAHWTALCSDCTGQIDSLVELLQGRFSQRVMERLCRPQRGLFPAPAEIALSCSCPDSAAMCKHVAATLYGVGARLDDQPELLFTLRQVTQGDLVARAGAGLELPGADASSSRVMKGEGLSELFGIELASETAGVKVGPRGPRAKRGVRAAPESRGQGARPKKRADARKRRKRARTVR